MTNNDPSDNVCIEHIRPKTVPDQLVALGTVSQVSDLQIKVQITSGVVCLVDRYSVSQPYTKSLECYERDYKVGKQPLIEPPKLSEIFKRGEQYVCKVIDRQTRKGYADAQDIIATLDPEQIQEDNVPAALLAIPNVPLQGAIISLEDYGYSVDIGFKSITGFLKYEECDDEQFHVGQLVRCCSKETLSVGDGSRIIQLSITKEALKESRFSREKCCHHILAPKLILPGSQGFLTVMKIQQNGLIVNFLDEFAGFVGLDHLEHDCNDARKKYKISDSRKCTVLYFNPVTKSFALSLKTAKYFQKTLRHILDNHHVGQIIQKAEVKFLNGLKSVYFEVGKIRAVANCKDSLNEDSASMTKDELSIALDSTYPDGSKHKARVKSINYADLMLVLSLRQEFLELSCVSVEELEPADFIEVTAKKHLRDGIVVSFGLNLRAIILNTHLKDNTTAKQYPIGMSLKCRVLKIDPDNHPTRVYLTNKEQLMDPEMTIIDAYESLFRGETVNAIIVKLKTDGLIVELFNNVKGYIPLRFCSSTKISSPANLFRVGQVVTCTIYRVDPNRQTISLTMIPYEKVVEMMKDKKKAKIEKRRQKVLEKFDSKVSADEKTTNKKIKSEKRKNDQVESSQKEQKGCKKLRKQTKSLGEIDQNECEENRSDKRERVSAADQAELPLKRQKTRLERSIAAKEREAAIREAESRLLDPNKPAQSIPDFERLILKSPNDADTWIKYSKFFLDNVETEKARIICRRALSTINFRLEKEKMKVWLHLILIDAKFGGAEKLSAVIEEASQTNDKLKLYRRACKLLISCGELDDADRMFNELLYKLGGKKIPDIWIDYLVFLMEQREDLGTARTTYDKALHTLEQLHQTADCIYFRSRFAHLEFKFGDVERGKTLFENLLSEHPKRMDLWSVYEGAIRKFGTRQLNTEEVRQQNEQILERIASLRK